MIHSVFYNRYLNQIDCSLSINQLLVETWQDFESVVKGKNAQWWNTAYAPDKWNPREVVMHLIDVERVYQYRAHCIASGEKGELPGFDENQYVANSHARNVDPELLISEFELLRKTGMLLFSRLNTAQIQRIGNANGHPTDVEALGYITAAHLHHHTQILKTKYP